MARINLAMREDDEDYPALRLANYIFGGGAGLNSRLMERIRQKDGLSYGIGSSLGVGDLDPVGSFTISGSAAPQNILKLEAAVLEEIQRVHKDGFSADELARAISGSLQQRVHSRSNDSNLAATTTGNLFLERSWLWSQTMDEKIKAVTLAQVNAAFRKYIVPEQMSSFIAFDQAKAK